LNKENFPSYLDHQKGEDISLIQQQRFIHSCPKEAEVILGKRWSDQEEEERQEYHKKKSNSDDNFSLFNCFHPNAKCQYYYPANFFDQYCGIGKSFLPVVRELQEKQANLTLWKNMPHLGIPLVTFQDTCFDKERARTLRLSRVFSSSRRNRTVFPPFSRAKNTTTEQQRRRRRMKKDDSNEGKYLQQSKGQRRRRLLQREKLKYSRLTNIGRSYMNDTKTAKKCITERFSFLHVHKNGGTSVRDTFAAIVRENSQSAAIERTIIWYGNSATSSAKGRASALELLQHATHYPTNGEYAPQQVVLITLVRDPLSRFISSIGQALGGDGSTNNKIGGVLRKACVQNESIHSSQDSLLCLARYVKEHGFWIELHFTPQALEISFATMFQDVPVAVLEFPPAEILDYIGGSAEQKQRDGAKEGYRPDPILTNMSVSHYTATSLKIVCDIYEMDVMMLRSLGIEVPKCDPYLS